MRASWRTASRKALIAELERQQRENERLRRGRKRAAQERDRYRRARDRLHQKIERLEDELDAARRTRRSRDPPGARFEEAAAVLEADFDGVLVRDGWAPCRRFTW